MCNVCMYVSITCIYIYKYIYIHLGSRYIAHVYMTIGST